MNPRLTGTQMFYLTLMERNGRLCKGLGHDSTLTVRLLNERGFATVSWWGAYWEAQITNQGRLALESIRRRKERAWKSE